MDTITLYTITTIHKWFGLVYCV